MKWNYLFVVLIGLFFESCSSLQQKAMNQFDAGEYQLAISSFSEILEKDPDNIEANRIVAESYRLSNRIENATDYYEKLVEGDPSYDHYFRYAESLRHKGQYKESMEAFEQAKAYTSVDSLVGKADLEIGKIQKLDQIEAYWPNHVLENYELLNTRGMDYAPVVNDGFIYFTSSREGGGIYNATGQSYTKLFRAKAEGIKVDVQNVQALPEFRNEEGLNQAAMAISPDGNTFVYARGNSLSKRDLPEVNLFVSYFRGAGFTQPIWMQVNDDETYWNSTPAFSPDGETLYFASNRPGGYGGIDLYKASKMANGDFGNVQNLGPKINTPGNELFPRPVANGNLYFSSDGHPGYGKLDLFVAKPADEGLQIINLGENINSVADDFAIFFTNYPKEGFISSNREGGVGDDDIYFFEDKTPKPKLVNVFLNLTVKERKEDGTEDILPQTRVVLYDSQNRNLGGDNTNQRGLVRFKLEPDATFSFIASKSGYFTKSVPYSTVGKTPRQEELIQDVTNITLDTTLYLDQLVLERSIVLENIYYDLDKADIRPDAALELDKLVQILKDNPSIRIELSSHTDARASDSYNDALSQRRAESAVNYIVSQGIERSRLVAKGYGKRQLIIPNAQTEEDHQVNRRTEFKVIEIED
ncbi:OmpA family protein [Pararhodonellum marinum]|uniref:OmpA family protein n=1 Tax=Pararhodonellum marinum TaxID=2755358 RepID=UPI00188FFAF0|nr:OmpA family protein [Pararhodonellum marinum]